MPVGQIYHDPQFRYMDSYSGREVIQLTDYMGHSNHFYFTDPCWFNDNQSFFFASDRANQSNLYRYDLADGKITQLTDFTERERPHACWSEANQRLYYCYQKQVYALNPETFEQDLIYSTPEHMHLGERVSPTADGKYIIARLQTPLQQKSSAIAFGYSDFRDLFNAKPLTQIIRIEIATGEVEILVEDERFMTHLNTSPTLPHIMTYCNEGPWDLVQQRIWGLNIDTGETWKIRPQDDGRNFAVGHEYWFTDGERIGYHGFPRNGDGEHVFGYIKWDNSDWTEVRFPFRSTHFHSLDQNLIVGDGSPAAVFTHQGVAQPFIQLFKWDGQAYEGPRILSYHRSTFNDQYAHPHPRFTPDGKYVLYTSDLTAYANMYLVEIGDFDTLPLLTEDILPRHT